MLLYMDLTGSILIALVLLLRLWKKSPAPAMFVVLWDAVLIRLLLPMDVPIPFVVYVLWDTATDLNRLPGQAWETLPWLWIWAAGAAAAAAFQLSRFIAEWHILREAIPLDPSGSALVRASGVDTGRTKVLVSDRVSTPVAGGLFVPRIVLPKSFVHWDRQTVSFVLTHELIHIRRCDTLQKLIMAAALCVHWFNPLVWAMQRYLDRDLERSCDERVVTVCGEQVRCDYAETLVALAAERTAWSGMSTGFGRSAISERVRSMLSHGPWSAFVYAGAALILLCAAASFVAAAPSAAPVPTIDSTAFFVYDAAGERVLGTVDADGIWDVATDVPGATSVSVVQSVFGDGQLQVSIGPPVGIAWNNDAGSAG